MSTYKTPDYIQKIRNSKTRFEAANWIRAFGCFVVGNSNLIQNPIEKCYMIEQYEKQARSLEQDFSFDADSLVTENQHPWKKWLKEWGF